MPGLNKVILIGNLGRDPEMRYLPSGSPVTSFSIAVSRRYKSREGEDREETDWFRISAFDRLAEIANEYLAKGRQVYVEGRVRLHTWSDKESGEQRAGLEVTASNIVLLGSRNEQGEGMGTGSRAPSSQFPENNDLDNMPF